MSARLGKVWSSLTMVIIAIALVFIYQNCSRITLVGQSEKASMSGGGNGDGYEGKPDKIFVERDTNQPCSDIGANGQALPNREIFYYKSLTYSYLMRDQCSDITPVKILNSDLQVNLNGATAIYQGQSYTLAPLGDFAVVAANCPAGMTLKTAAVRQNLFADSQDLSAASWSIHPGLQNPPTLEQTIAGLPGWAVRRVGPRLDFFLRASKLLNVTAGTRYALTYLARGGTKNATSIHLWQYQAMSFIFEVDFANGAVTVTDQQRIQNPVVVTSPLSGGWQITLYFTPEVSQQIDVGITPQARYPSGALGDDIYVTAGELEEVANFCQ